MLFIHKETGEICEAFIKSVSEVKEYNGMAFYAIGEIAMVGNLEYSENDPALCNEMFEFLGLL